MCSEEATPQMAIRLSLDDRGLTYRDAAEKLGISLTYLSDIINGKARISVGFAKRWERAFGLDGKALLMDQVSQDWRFFREDRTTRKKT